MKRIFILLFLLNHALIAQYDQQARNAFLENQVNEAFDYQNIQRPDLKFHSSFKPYLSSTFSNYNDSLIPFKFYAFKNYFLSKTFNEKPQKRNWFNLQLHPVVNASIGYDPLLKSPLAEYLGGMHLKTNINDDFTFAATLVGGRVSLPYFNDTLVYANKVIPEFGQAYSNNKKGYQVFDYTGYLSYSPHNNKVFNFQAGRDRHFIGDGYRSLLLSDVAPAYPFFRINTNIWRFQYNVWYTMMTDISGANGEKEKFRTKFASFHYLSYNITKELNVSVFENIIWRGNDSLSNRTFDVNYLNPVIFFRPVEYSVGSPDNALMGLNISYKFKSHFKLYGQLALDEFLLSAIRARTGWWANKQAWQLGARYINAFGKRGLSFQFEYNEVRPYTYTHGIVQQNYAHYGSPLAHPMGANFRELLGMVKFRKKNIEFSGKLNYALIGKDTSNSKTNMGQNLFISYVNRPYEYGHYTGQGIQNNFLQFDFKFTYFLIPDMNLRMEAGFIQRSQSTTEGYIIQDPFIYFGIKSGIWNSYRDY
ncbi:MAG: hypothetical protein IPM51_14895 [Sphingobacteriaceae bacterium]|nr:hypothetical protein [Sphingobacteriaceae bacterium]